MISFSNLPIFLYFQFITAVLVVSFYNKNSLFHKLLCIYLIVTFFVELLGTYLGANKMDNFLLYHFYSLIEFTLILMMYRSVVRDVKLFKIAYVLLLVVFLFWTLTFYKKEYFTIMTVLGYFNVGILSFLYMRELLISNELINYKKLLPFWVSVGFIVFYLTLIPFMSFWNFMNNRAFIPILHALIILMNLIISFGLIWSYKKVESY